MSNTNVGSLLVVVITFSPQLQDASKPIRNNIGMSFFIIVSIWEDNDKHRFLRNLYLSETIDLGAYGLSVLIRNKSLISYYLQKRDMTNLRK